MAISAKKTVRGISSPKLSAGTYDDAFVFDVRDAEVFFPGESFAVYHKVAHGRDKLVYKEIFLFDERDERTQEFYEYIEANGFSREDLLALIGMRERLTLLKQKKGRGIYLNVYAREFLGHSEAS